METSPTYRRVSVGEARVEQCESDSPEFRAALQHASGELDELEDALDAASKGARAIAEYAARGQEALAHLLVHVRRVCALEVLERTPDVLRALVAAAELSVVAHERAAMSVPARVFGEALPAVLDAVQAVRDARRAEEKSRERYENAAARFSALPRLRDQPLVREDAHHVLECRKAHCAHLVDYVLAVQRARAASDGALCRAALSALSAATGGARALGAAMDGLSASAETYGAALAETWEPAWRGRLAEAEALGRRLLAQVRVRTVLDGEAGATPQPGGALRSYREGYLYVRRQKGLGSIWRRVYVALRPVYGDAEHGAVDAPDAPDGAGDAPAACVLVQQTLASRRGGVVETAFVINVLLVEARALEGADVDRRFCFEVATARKSLLYQAESDEDVREWLRAVGRAKSDALLAADGGEHSARLSHMSSAGSLVHVAGGPHTGAESAEAEDGGLVAVAATLIEEAPGTSARAEAVFAGHAFSRALQPGETIVLSLPALVPADVLAATSVCVPPEAKVLGRVVVSDRALYVVSAAPGVQCDAFVLWRDVTDVRVGADGALDVCVREGSLGSVAAAQHGNASGLLGGPQDAVRSAAQKTGPYGLALIVPDEGRVRDVLVRVMRNSRAAQPRTGAALVAALEPGAEDEIGEDALAESAAAAEDAGPAENVQCGCEAHLERVEIDVIVPLPVDDLFELLMAPESPVFREMNARRKHRRVAVGPWVSVECPERRLGADSGDSVCRDEGGHMDAERKGSLDDPAVRTPGVSPSVSTATMSSASTESAESASASNGSAPRTSAPGGDTGRASAPGAGAHGIASDDKRGTDFVPTRIAFPEAPVPQTPDGAILGRDVRFVVPVDNPMIKARETQCLATHWVLRREPARAYVVRQEARTPAVTYGDSFAVVTLFCLTSAGPRRTRLCASTGITWLRSTLVRGIIRAGIMRSQADYFRVYASVLWPAVRERLALSPSEGDDALLAAAEADAAAENEAAHADATPAAEATAAARHAARALAGALWAAFSRVRALLAGEHRPDALVLSASVLLSGIVLGVFMSRSVHTPGPGTERTALLPLKTLPEYNAAVLRSDAGPGSRVSLRLGRTGKAYGAVRSELSRLADDLRRAECRLAQARYAAWLADSLAACYARGPSSRCSRLAAAYDQAVDPSICRFA